MYKRVEKCRICGNRELAEVLHLGDQALTGVFPKSQDQRITSGPLTLVKCVGDERVCGLLQLAHSYELGEMYGLNYGYRSGLNASMVKHLRDKVERILALGPLEHGALVLDIGSNDSTTLQGYPAGAFCLVGVDPTGPKFTKYYPPHIELIPDFFSAERIRERFGSKKASIVTSFSMFYDLEDPVSFMRDVAEVLDDAGIWVFEQSYLPTMLARNSYDTVCHEHLEYYALSQVKWMAEAAGLELLDAELNDVNGGSFSVVAAKKGTKRARSGSVEALLALEHEQQLNTLAPYLEFARRVRDSREQLVEFLDRAVSEGRQVGGLGASTKGNVLLQYCEIRASRVIKIGEVNQEKYGCFTPGTLIPIVPEDELLRANPDYLLVLPWHFRSFFLKGKRFAGRQLVFPLPKLQVVQT